MRQNNVIFDIENKLIGMARAKCNFEPTMILSEQDYIDYGNTFGLDTDQIKNEVEVDETLWNEVSVNSGKKKLEIS